MDSLDQPSLFVEHIPAKQWKVKIPVSQEAWEEETLICGCRGVKKGSPQHAILVMTFGGKYTEKKGLTSAAMFLRECAENQARGLLFEQSKTYEGITFEYSFDHAANPFLLNGGYLLAVQKVGPKVQMVGPKKPSYYEPSYVHAPYVPIVSSPVLTPESFVAGMEATKAKYAGKAVNPSFFELVNVQYGVPGYKLAGMVHDELLYEVDIETMKDPLKPKPTHAALAAAFEELKKISKDYGGAITFTSPKKPKFPDDVTVVDLKVALAKPVDYVEMNFEVKKNKKPPRKG